MAGRKWHRPTAETRKQVTLLAAVGARHEDIASKLGISADTLVRHYQAELDAGRIDANARVAQTLYQQALAGNTAAMIFWLKARAGWRETQVHQHSGADGLPLAPPVFNIGFDAAPGDGPEGA